MDHEDITAITEYITKGVYPRGISKGEKRSMRKRCQSFTLTNGVLYHHGNKHKKQRLVVTDPDEKLRILDTVHRDSDGRPNHNRIKFTHQKVTNWYWWRGITEDVKAFCKRCPECAQLAAAAVGAGAKQNASDPEESDSDMRDLDHHVEPLCIAPIPVVELRELTSTSHKSDLVTSLRRLFEEKVGFDVVLSAGGFQVSAHKVVVMATSDYLKSLIVDQDPPTTMDKMTIQLTNISGLCLEPIVTFLYTGTLRLSQENVHLMSAAAAQLGISSAVALCQKFLMDDGKKAAAARNDDISMDNDIDVKNDDSDSSSDTKALDPIPFVPGAPQPNTNNNSNALDDFLILNIKEEVPTIPMVNLEDFVASISKSAPRAATAPRHKRTLLPNCFVAISPTPRFKPPPGSCTTASSRSARHSTRSTMLRKILPKPRPKMSRADELRRRKLQKSRRTAMAKTLLQTHGKRHACYVCESVFEFASGLKHHQRMRHGIPRLDLALYRLSQMSVRAAIRSVLRRGRPPPQKPESKSRGKSSTTKKTDKVRKNVPDLSDGVAKVGAEALEKPTPAPVKRKIPRRASGKSRDHSGSVFRMWSKAVRYERMKHRTGKNRGGAPTVIPIFRNKCGWCGRSFLRRADLLEHRKVFHRSRKKPPGYEPEKRHRNDWSCPERGCDARPKTMDELKEHMSAAHPNVFLSCPHCKFKTQVDHNLKRHLTKRHRERHICPICSRSYHKMCLLRIHMYNQHKVEDPSLKLERCPHEGCNYACPGKWALKTHMLKHSASKPFTCDKCGRDFKRALSLEKHINKIHLGIRGYICDKCGGSFADESELKRHSLRHDKNMAFMCTKCPFQSYIKAAYQSHMYSRHQMIVNDKMHLFKCDQCAFATDRRHRYTEHVKKHANIRDIPCPECGKLFITQKTMRQHIVKVHKQTTIYCTLCPFRTLSQAKLREHVTLMHDLQSDLVDPAGSSIPDNGGSSTGGVLSHSNAGASSHRSPVGGSSHRNATRTHSKAVAASRGDVDVSPCSMVAHSGNAISTHLPYSNVGAQTLYTESRPSVVGGPLMLGVQCAPGFPGMLPVCDGAGIPMSIDNSFCRFGTFNGGSGVR